METFDLGRILSTAESIKAQRDQGVLGRLQQQYIASQESRAVSADQRAAAVEERATTKFNQEQQLENTKLLNMAAAEVAQNPQAIGRWMPQLKQAGVFGADYDLSGLPPEQIQQAAAQLLESTSTALQAYSQSAAQGGRENIGNANVGDFEPQSYQAWLRSGSTPQTRDYSLLKRTWAPPAVSVRSGPDIGTAIIDPGNRLGGGQVTQITSPEERRAGSAAEAAAKTSATEGVKQDIQQMQALQKSEPQITGQISLIDQLASHPDLPRVVGLWSRLGGTSRALIDATAGTQLAEAAAMLAQIQDQNFLQAFESLKGGGPISNVEGQAATNAQSRITQGGMTYEAMQRALQELRDSIDSRLTRVRESAASASQRQQSPANDQPAASGGVVDWSELQ